MIAPDPKLLCKQAESYYYDFLHKETIQLIPEPIVSHINHCATCKEQVNQLRAVLIKSEEHLESDQKEVSSAVTELLKLHFAYIGKPVTCDIVKPFLLGLLDTALEIRIPTPITIHLDNCRQCSEDLETIRRLNLSHRQLYRLSQLFADETSKDKVNCLQARAAILSVVFMRLHETNADVLRHLCICPGCQKALYDYRESVRSDLLLNRSDQKEFPCEQVSATDIFDYVVPYGLNPAKDQYAKFRGSLTSHLVTCPTCLAKMQQLHNTVYGIVEQTESGVVTLYHIDESAKAKAVCETEELYAGFPIRAEVMEQKDEVKDEQPAPAFNIASALKGKVSTINRKLTVKTIATVAAVILIGFALLLNITSAKAVTIDQICKAIEKVKNVHITKFVPDKTEPAQEQWVSRALNIYMTKTAEQCVFWDIANGVTKIKHLDTGAVETTRLSAENITGIEKKMSGSLGLIPFYDIFDIPADAEWGHANKASLEVDETIEAYDLMWIDRKYINLVVFKRWRVFVDPKTNLPQRTEFYQKLATDSEYSLKSAKMIEYLSDSEMQEVIEEVSF